MPAVMTCAMHCEVAKLTAQIILCSWMLEMPYYAVLCHALTVLWAMHTLGTGSKLYSPELPDHLCLFVDSVEGPAKSCSLVFPRKLRTYVHTYDRGTSLRQRVTQF